MDLSVRVNSASGPAVVGGARELVRSVLAFWDCDDLNDAGALLTSEIVTNAVRHAAGVLAMQFDLFVADGMVRVGVEDRTSAPPVLKTPDVDAAGGRGLLLVEALAARWGSTPTEAGKVVWFEFPVRCRDGAVLPGPK